MTGVNFAVAGLCDRNLLQYVRCIGVGWDFEFRYSEGARSATSVVLGPTGRDFLNMRA